MSASIATGGRVIEPLHTLPEPHLRRIEVGARLREVLVSEHVLHMMQRPAGFQQPRAALMPEIVEVQIDHVERGA